MEEQIQLQSSISESYQNQQLLRYDNNLSSTDYCQSDDKYIPQELQIIPIKIHKQIVKSKRYLKKGFITKKQFEVVPILTKQIYSATKYLLFGFHEVETYYKDYTDPYDFDLTSQLNSIQQVELIENNKIKNELQIFLNNQGSSGITDFNFLIEHFSRFTTQEYHQLYMQLIQYQNLTKLHVQHIQDVKIQVIQRLISLEDIQQARVDFLQFVDNFVQQQIEQGNYFYAYQLYMIDIDRMDINTDRKCVSLSLMSLLGVEPEDYRLLIFNQLNSFEITFGKQRLNSALEGLNMIINNNLYTSKDYTMCTIDDIYIPTKESFEIVCWEQRPKWASKCDYTLLFQKFDISADQIQQVIQERSQKQEIQIDDDELKESIKLEYVIQSEIFIEKYYPDLYKQLQNKKSVKLISLNKEKNSNRTENQIVID
ncbi:hypothetical protein ABPG74_022715 [Tetrahymena malaccensis]